MTKLSQKLLQSLAAEHGTPLVVVDHEAIRENYATFKRHLPRVQAYYAVKANPAPEIVQTLFKAGASFDVASFPEFMLVYELIRRRPARDRQDFVWDKIVYANPVKAKETLEELNEYKPLVTLDNRAEVGKVAEHAPNAGLLVRLRVPNTGSMVELSSKFGCEPGEAVALMLEARDAGLVVEGLSFHVGSQCTNFENFVQALNAAAAVMKESAGRGHAIKILDIGGGFPAPYNKHVRPFRELARVINAAYAKPFLQYDVTKSISRPSRSARPRGRGQKMDPGAGDRPERWLPGPARESRSCLHRLQILHALSAEPEHPVDPGTAQLSPGDEAFVGRQEFPRSVPLVGR